LLIVSSRTTHNILSAGIYGHAHIAELVLQAGGDANIRSTFAGGLRMTPLSWNVYGGHVAATKVLLQHGAHVNLDFDAASHSGRKGSSSTKKKVTVYDVLMDILDRSGGGGGGGSSNDPQQQQRQQQTANEENGMDRYWEVRHSFAPVVFIIALFFARESLIHASYYKNS
jgi:hypothetical protein